MRDRKIMRVASLKTKLSILLDYVDEWRARAGSREAVALSIVEVHVGLGMNEIPKMEFSQRGDAFTRGKNAADRIFRWLDDKTKDGTLMPANFETSILAAMPEDLRVAYLNDVLAPLGLVVEPVVACSDRQLDGVQHLVAVSRESSEATSALAEVVSAPTLHNLRNAERELADADGAIQKARGAIRVATAQARPQAVR
jgi:hypothetical protein